MTGPDLHFEKDFLPVIAWGRKGRSQSNRDWPEGHCKSVGPLDGVGMKDRFGMMLEVTLKVLGDRFNIEVRAFFKLT